MEERVSNELIFLYQQLIDCSIESLTEEVLSIAETASRRVVLSCRVKDSSTLAKKMIAKSTKSIMDIHDVYGIRVLVFSVSEAYAVLKAITDFFPSFLDHDYIANPKTRSDKPHLAGKSLRLLQVIAQKNSVPFEIQITTFEFNDCNELLHEEYHREKYQTTDLSD